MLLGDFPGNVRYANLHSAPEEKTKPCGCYSSTTVSADYYLLSLLFLALLCPVAARCIRCVSQALRVLRRFEGATVQLNEWTARLVLPQCEREVVIDRKNDWRKW